MRIHFNNFTDQPYKLKKGMHIATFSVMIPEQMKYVRSIDPVSTWHLLNENEEDAHYYISSLFKANKNNDQYEKFRFPTPENPGDETTHTPIQQKILRELRNLQDLEQLNPHDDAESRRKFLSYFYLKDSMLQQHKIRQIETLLVEFHDIFARHRFDIGVNEEFTVKLTPKDASPFPQSEPTYSGQPQRGHIGRTGATSQIWFYNDTTNLKVRQSHICAEKIQWKTETVGGFEKN